MRYIDHKKLYELTENGLTIFQHFYPGVDFGDSKHNVKVRQDEKTASAKVTWYDGLWRITDFGNQDVINGMPGIEFVRHKETLSYYDALLFVESVIIKHEIPGSSFKPIQYKADYEMREMTPEDQKGETKLVFKEKVEKSDLAAIGRYVDEDTLKYFHCKCVESYSLCTFSKKLNKDVVHIFKATKDYPIFVFDYGTFKKLYKPHEMDKKYRFSYVGEKPKNFIYGLQQLQDCDCEFTNDSEDENPITRPFDKPNALVIDLFRCSGESDAMNLHSLGYHVYWLNSESEDFNYKQFREVDELCVNHYQIMDLDATGKIQAQKNALKHIDIYTLELPEWIKFSKDFRGNPCKDLKDFINISGDSIDQTIYNFLVLKKNARRVKFWNKIVDEKKKTTNYNVNMEFFYFFLKCNGFYQMESIYHKKAGYCYAWVKGKVVDLIHPDNIKRIVKRFTKEWIKSKNRMDGLELLNKINTSNQIVEANLENIDMIDCCFKNYGKEVEYIHFKNGSLKITPNKIEKINHQELQNYILGSLEVNNKTISHLIPRDIRVIDKPAIEIKNSEKYQELLDKYDKSNDEAEREIIDNEILFLEEIDKYEVKINDDNFIFVKFLQDLSHLYWRKELEEKKELNEIEIKEQNLCIANLLFVIGYHCQQYKDPGKPWITFLQDMLISEVGQSSGGSGKSLLSMAPTKVRASFYKGGRVLDDKNQYQFFYDGATEFHDYYEVDDMHEYADVNFLYTSATGKREINPKNYAAITLNYEDSGKMLISSNYELPNTEASTYRRILNAGVSDYYHQATKMNNYKESRSPLTKFGKLIYDDFTDEEWVKFYNLMAYCVQLVQRIYKINAPAGNLEKRQLRRAMSEGLGRDEDFFKWAKGYFKYDDTKIPISGICPDINEDSYLNSFIIKDAAFENFQKSLTSKQKNTYKSNKFKKHVMYWCEYNGYEYNPLEYCYGDPEDRRINKSIDGKTKECFYIRTKNKVIEGGESVPMVKADLDKTLPF